MKIKGLKDLTFLNGLYKTCGPIIWELFAHSMHESSEKYSKKLAKIVDRKAVGNLIDVGG